MVTTFFQLLALFIHLPFKYFKEVILHRICKQANNTDIKKYKYLKILLPLQNKAIEVTVISHSTHN